MLEINIDPVLLVPLEAKKLRQHITESFEGVTCGCDVAVSVVNTFVFDEKGDSQPYFHLRVYLNGGSFEDLKNVKQCFDILDMKMEIFVHAKK